MGEKIPGLEDNPRKFGRFKRDVFSADEKK